MIARVYVNGADARIVRGESVEQIARVQFGRGGDDVYVRYDVKTDVHRVYRKFGAQFRGVIGRIKIIEG